eukprot:GILI01013130.1.p1 GENE.GILI01013130.1~~GILI01013130.1.p1  ORF type:complete len:206 (-),score=11.64 GILI01013130.1:105-722(-)
MGVDVHDLKDKIGNFVSKFFSLIIALLSCIASLVYIIGAFKFITYDGTFSRTEVAHVLALLVTTAATAGYFLLHFVPKKRYRVLYSLSGLLVVSVFLSAHSLGLVAPTVDDCDDAGLLMGTTSLVNRTIIDAETAKESVIQMNITEIRGQLGQSLGNCVDSEIIFAGCFMLSVFHIIAVFDTQRMLAARIRSKSYSERFAEMGFR